MAVDGEPLDSSKAKALIRAILSTGSLALTTHAREEMAKDALSQVDVVNVLRAGQVATPAEQQRGTWRYRVCTQRIAVIVAFRSQKELVVVTAWRLNK